MNILVTGGLGFIGHNVVQQLEQQGHNIVILDSCTDYGFIPREEMIYLIPEREKKIKTRVVHYHDLSQTSMFEWLIPSHQIDAIVHLAGYPRQKVVDSNPAGATNTMSTQLVKLLELTVKYKVPKFVYISSSMVYGDFERNVKEDAMCNPQGLYAVLKYAGELLVKDYAKKHRFDYTIVRPSAVYGELDVSDRVISKFILAALRNEDVVVKGPQEVLDFTHVSDTAQGIVLATTKAAANNQTFNITRSDDIDCTLQTAADFAIAYAGGGRLMRELRDASFPKRGKLCIDHAVNLLGYEPVVNVESGIYNYVQWYKESAFWQANI